MAELVEGAPLLRAYTRKTRIVGSNPTLSANYLSQAVSHGLEIDAKRLKYRHFRVS